MKSIRRILPLVLIAAPALPPLAAQTVITAPAAAAVHADTTQQSDDEGVPLGWQYGVAAGALQYGGGRTEQALGVILRWAPARWFSLSSTPTAGRIHEPSLTTGVAGVSRGGLMDLPVEATMSHAFGGSLSPTISGGLGMTLPVGDSASGFGAGRVGWSTSVGLGFSPVEKVWMHLGAGRSLDGGARSAFTSGSGWGDASAGFSATERVSVSGGYSSDLGSVDSTLGRSTSVNAGLALSVHGASTVHLNASHGLGGAAPRWSVSFGFGTAFPYLNHLGGGSSIDQLRQTFGWAPHGLGTDTSGSTGVGRGRGRP